MLNTIQEKENLVHDCGHRTYLKVSMTQLLSHTIAHFTGPSFMLPDNNQTNKNLLGVHLCKFNQKMASILENKEL